jgi:hypothetical protein
MEEFATQFVHAFAGDAPSKPEMQGQVEAGLAFVLVKVSD